MLFSEQPGLAREMAERVVGAVGDGDQQRGNRTFRGTFVTAAEILQKRAMASLLPAGTVNPVLEMESAAVARIAAREGVPLVALRAISDGAEEELGFAIGEFVDREMRIRAWKVLLTIARKPRIIPQLVRLAGNARLAGQNLAVAVKGAVSAL
jgi:adenosylhomocysteine nucleosidase